jgi:hypothetical protein
VLEEGQYQLGQFAEVVAEVTQHVAFLVRRLQHALRLTQGLIEGAISQEYLSQSDTALGLAGAVVATHGQPELALDEVSLQVGVDNAQHVHAGPALLHELVSVLRVHSEL